MIKIICVGKIKEKYYKDAIKEYSKRLSKYTKFIVHEVNDEKGDSIPVVLLKEKERIEKNIYDKDFVITMEISGKEMNSINFAKKIDQLLIHHPNIVFIIGGSYGLHENIKRRSNLQLSFSKMTFPHQLFRIILLEQLYRSFKIIKNETYHK